MVIDILTGLKDWKKTLSAAMSMEEERERTPPRKAVSGPRSAQRRRKLLEGRNSKASAVSEGTEKEKRKLRNSAKRRVKTTMQRRIGSGVPGLATRRSLNGKLKGSISHDGDYDFSDDFEMLKIHHGERADDDSLSMLSIDSRPSSCTTLDSFEVQSMRNIDEFENLEDFSTEESGKTLITSEEANQSGLAPNLVSDNSRSPGLQVAQLEAPNNENFEKLGKGDLESINFNIQDKEEPGSEYESERKTKLKVKTAWELNDKFLLTTEFPAEVWDEKTNNNSLLTNRRPSSDLLNASFPPLAAFRESRRGSLPVSSSNYLFFSSKTPPEFPLLSGRQCKVQLPSNFPGVPSPPSESDSESSNNEHHKEVLEREKTAQKSDQKPPKIYLEIPFGKHVQKLTTSSARETPNLSGSHSPKLSSEHLAIRAASTEYLATRVVTQLNCAFRETVGESHEEVTSRANCVTPNLMPRRDSVMSFRTNTSSFFEEKTNSLTLPSVHNECSKSLPNLSDHEKSRRMFVTFDKDYPRAKVVDLKGKSDLAQKCRVLDRRLTNEDSVVKAMLKDKVHKKSMIKKWVIASTQGI